MRLPDAVLAAAQKAGVTVYYADRKVMAVWNRNKDRTDLTRYCGWYWLRTHKGKVIDMDESGPFKSRMAAFRDAFVKLQLRADDGRNYNLLEYK